MTSEVTTSRPFPSALVAVGDPIEVQREWTRSYLAWAVVGLLGLVIVLIAIWFYSHSAQSDGLSALLTGLFTPLIGLAGTVLGFYFGAGGTKSSGSS